MIDTNVKMKQELRKRLIERRDALGETRSVLTEQIVRHVLELKIWKEAQRVALYVSTRSEVATEGLLREGWQSGKKIFLPRCLSAGAKKDANPGEGGGIMEMALCNSLEDLEPARFGLLEPRKTCLGLPLPEKGEEGSVQGLPELILVPAVGIDQNGGRLGYGGGFYDRLLSRPGWESVPRLGLVFKAQILPTVPSGTGDVCLHGFVTEDGCVWI